MYSKLEQYGVVEWNGPIILSCIHLWPPGNVPQGIIAKCHLRVGYGDGEWVEFVLGFGYVVASAGRGMIELGNMLEEKISLENCDLRLWKVNGRSYIKRGISPWVEFYLGSEPNYPLNLFKKRSSIPRSVFSNFILTLSNLIAIYELHSLIIYYPCCSTDKVFRTKQSFLASFRWKLWNFHRAAHPGTELIWAKTIYSGSGEAFCQESSPGPRGGTLPSS